MRILGDAQKARGQATTDQSSRHPETSDRHMTTPLVTVCIPTFNGALHLRECLSSVCLQTYGNTEILVVDDCSSDATAEIVLEFAKRDTRVRFMRNQETLGLMGNWQRCIEIAQGEFIKFAF